MRAFEAMSGRLALAGAAVVVAIAGGAVAAASEGGRTIDTARTPHSKTCRPTGHGTLLFRRVFIGATDGSRLFDARDANGRYAKVGLLVREGTTVELSTKDPGRVRMIGWATDEPDHVQTVDPSTPADGLPEGIPTTGNCSDDWNFYAGGFVFTGKQCATVHVAVGDRTRDLRFGLGKGCGPTASPRP